MPRAIASSCSLLFCVLGACHRAPQPPSGGAASQASVTASSAPAPASLPRPVLPQSAAMLFGSEVFFRWLGAGTHAELARDRAFSSVVQSSPADVNQAVLHVPSGIWFWRVVDRSGHASAVWPFEVMPGARTGHASSLLLPADFNGDMLADLTVQDGVVLGGAKLPTTEDLIPLDFGALKIPELVRAQDDADYIWSGGYPAGDIDGDGFGDMTAQVVRQAVNMDQRIPVALLFDGARQISKRWTASARISRPAGRLGDVNEDGYADAWECPLVTGKPETCFAYAGSAQGLSSKPLFELNEYVLGGTDLDGDDHADLVGLSGDGTLRLYLGPLTGPKLLATRAWSVPHAQRVELADLDGDGHIDIWGISGEGSSALTVWEVAGKDILTASGVRKLGSVTLPLGGQFAFVPGVGSKRDGLLTFSTGEFPSFAFAQTQYPLALARALASAPPTDTRPDGISSVTELQSIGDFNGDGWSDLLVTRSTDAQDVTSEVYLGGTGSFVIRSPGAGFMSGGPINFQFY